MAEAKVIYWLITTENVSYLSNKCYAFLTTTSFTYEQFMAKANSAVNRNYSTSTLFTYTREDGIKDVVIDSEESLRIAIAHMDEGAFDARRGILIYRG